MQNLFLVGTVGSSEVMSGKNGNVFTKFSVATNKVYKNKAGEEVKETSWHNVLVSGERVDIVKGKFVFVLGEPKVNEYQTKEGAVAKSFQVIASVVITDGDVTKTIPSKVIALIKELRALYSPEAASKEETSSSSNHSKNVQEDDDVPF